MTALRFHEFCRPSASLVERLATYRTADVANALGDRAVLCGPAIHQVWAARPVAGVAFTVALAPGDNLGAIAASLLAEPGDVLVLDGGGEANGALVGGRLARVAMSRGVRACIVDGAVRDVDDLERLQFPVFARAVSARRATKVQPATLGCTVRCGDASIAAGDAILADRDGIAVISASRLEEALIRIAAAAAAEREEEADFAVLEARFRAISATAELIRLPSE